MLTAAQARRAAVRAQLLTRPRPHDVLGVVRRLGVLQLDPTAHVAPSADVVLWSRLGSAYDPAELRDLLDTQALVEVRMMARPAEDLRLLTAEMAAWPGEGGLTPWQEELVGWVRANDAARRDVLAALRADGPLPATGLPDTCAVPWRSSGWTDGRSRGRLLDLMVQRGEVAVAGRQGRVPLYDLASRVHPGDEPVPAAEARAQRDVRRLAALGVARPRAAQAPGEPHDVGAAGVEARVEGLRGRWRVDPAYLADWDPAEARVALLSPLDRLVMDRRRTSEVFGFDYTLEMYKPAARRRFGYWALPVLVGDRLVGTVDAEAVREAGELHVHAVRADPAHDDWTPAVRDAVGAEVDRLAAWLQLTPVREPGA